MYICSCFAVTDRQIREAAENGKPFRYLRDTYQLGTQCGKCVRYAKEIFDKHAPPNPPAEKPAKRPPRPRPCYCADCPCRNK